MGEVEKVGAASGLDHKLAEVVKAVKVVAKTGVMQGNKIARTEDVIAAVTAETSQRSLVWQTALISEGTGFDAESHLLNVWLSFWWVDLETGEKSGAMPWLVTVKPAGNHTMGMAYTYATRTWLQCNLNLLMVDEPEDYVEEKVQDRRLDAEEIKRVAKALASIDPKRQKLLLASVGVDSVEELMVSHTKELYALLEAEKEKGARVDSDD